MKYIILIPLSIVIACTLALPAFANDFALKIEEKAPPEELADVVKDGLEHKSYQLSDGDGMFFEIWLAKEIKVGEEKETIKKTLDTVDSISLLGAMIVHKEERYDFREDPMDLGLYVLRLSLQPQDGNHMGTAPFDTFAILIPHEMDKMVLELMDHDEMVDIASEPTAAEHPPILSMQPMDSNEGEFPRLGEHDEEEWFFMCLQLPGKAGDKEVKIPVHLIFEGIGDL
jgi:hypothetical protein